MPLLQRQKFIAALTLLTLTLILLTSQSTSSYSSHPFLPPSSISSWFSFSSNNSSSLPNLHFDPTLNPYSTQPLPRPLPPSPHRKYISYLPNSGFHNQRIELLNALSLASYLNRTLLLPPIWVGAGAPWGTEYERMKMMWEDRVRGDVTFGGNIKANQDSNQRLGTFVSWDFIVDIQKLMKKGEEERIINRWWGIREKEGEEPGMTEIGVEGEIPEGLEEGDKLILGDFDRYDNLYSDHLPADAPLITNISTSDPSNWQKYQHIVSLKTLRERSEKLILLGTVFGSSRVTIKNRPFYAHGARYFGDRLIFRQEKLDDLSSSMGGLLKEKSMEVTGETFYVGALARVSDGPFAARAEEHMDRLLQRIVKGVMDLEYGGRDTPMSQVDRMLKMLKEMGRERKEKLMSLESNKEKEGIVKKGKKNKKRNLDQEMEDDLDEYDKVKAWDEFEGDYEDGEDGEEKYHWSIGHSSGELKKRTLKRGQARVGKRQFDELVDGKMIEAPPPIDNNSLFEGIIPEEEESKISLEYEEKEDIEEEEEIINLKCRSPLHSSSDFKRFNVPIYLATDSNFPIEDSRLSLFFTTFPCLFIFDDFLKVKDLGLRDILKWKNNQDGGSPLGGFLVTILEAMTAARGRIVFGTSGSTFGSYAENILHPAYLRMEQEAEEKKAL